MKIITTSSGSKLLSISKSEWLSIGNNNGWNKKASIPLFLESTGNDTEITEDDEKKMREYIGKLNRYFKFKCKSYINTLCYEINKLLKSHFGNDLISGVMADELYDTIRASDLNILFTKNGKRLNLRPKYGFFNTYYTEAYYTIRDSSGISKIDQVNIIFYAYLSGRVECSVVSNYDTGSMNKKYILEEKEGESCGWGKGYETLG